MRVSKPVCISGSANANGSRHWGGMAKTPKLTLGSPAVVTTIPDKGNSGPRAWLLISRALKGANRRKGARVGGKAQRAERQITDDRR